MSNRNVIPRLLFSRREAAASLGVSTSTLDGLIRSGALAHVKISNRVFINIETLKDFAAKGYEGRVEPTREQ